MDGFLFVRNVVSQEVASAARSAILAQAANEGSVRVEPSSFEDGRIAKIGRKWAEPYVLNGETGSEEKSRPCDEKAWKRVTALPVVRNVFDGSDIQRFWNHLFGTTKPILGKGTFLRLVGKDGSTAEHAVR